MVSINKKNNQNFAQTNKYEQQKIKCFHSMLSNENHV